jgi:hypothetical protein
MGKIAFLLQVNHPQLGRSHPLSNVLQVKELPVVPHKAVAEVSKIGNLQERLVVVNPGW